MTSAYPYASYYGPSAYVKKGEPLGKNYFDNPTRDYHGGYARQHHAEMRQIALQTVQEVAPKLVDEICTAIWNDALQRLVRRKRYFIYVSCRRQCWKGFLNQQGSLLYGL